jgi:uncharacterized protein YdhG (YjbR/CyaY superfamily)
MNTYKTVDEYIAKQTVEVQPILIKMRTLIKGIAPDAEETISYGMPGYKLNKKPLVYFGAFKKHIGLYPTPSGIEAFRKELSEYEGAKGSIQFPLDQPMPYDLIARIVHYRVGENASK